RTAVRRRHHLVLRAGARGKAASQQQRASERKHAQRNPYTPRPPHLSAKYRHPMFRICKRPTRLLAVIDRLPQDSQLPRRLGAAQSVVKSREAGEGVADREEGFVDLVAAVVAYEQSLELVQPGEGALDDPAGAAEAGAVLSVAAGDFWSDPALAELAAMGGVV